MEPEDLPWPGELEEEEEEGAENLDEDEVVMVEEMEEEERRELEADFPQAPSCVGMSMNTLWTHTHQKDLGGLHRREGTQGHGQTGQGGQGEK